MANTAVDKLAVLQGLSQEMTQIVGFSFILGSLFTILILILLDWIKSRRTKSQQ